jgi:hypothetical protein
MDLKEGWERKALIALGVIILIIIVYAYVNPFSGAPDNSTQQAQITPAQVTPLTYSTTSNNNSTGNNSTINGNFTLSAAQAQSIAQNAFPGYSIGSPTQGNVVVNGTAHSVWIVSVRNNTVSRTLFVDASTGTIIQIS